MGEMPQDIKERTLEFSVRVIRLYKSEVVKNDVPRPIADQFLRSGTSIGANVEEAYGGESKKDFIHKMALAQKEARETLYWMNVCVRSELITESKLINLIDETNQLVSILTTIVKNARQSD